MCSVYQTPSRIVRGSTHKVNANPIAFAFGRIAAATAAAVLTVATSQAAMAQERHETGAVGAPASAAPAEDTWQFAIGLGAINQPRYPGSAERKTSGFPVLSAEYGRYFIGSLPGAGVPAGLGAYLLKDDHWQVGIGLGGDIDTARKESDSARLRGLGDIDGTAFGAVFASYGAKWFSVRGSTVSDIGGKGQGTRVSLALEGKLPIGERVELSAGPSVTWADARYTQKFFGVDEAQSARSGLAVYRPAAGINSVGLSVGVQVQLTPAWGVGAMLEASRLQGDAADSPVVERKSQTSVGVFAAYRF